jgi:shikimate kinase
LKIKRNIYLVGFMGTGKSTVGRELARLLGRKFIDMDIMLEKKMGKTINELYDEFGEDFLDEQELNLAKELSQQTGRVIASGGNTILNDEIRKMFSETGLIICLVVDKEELVNRLKRTDKRPLLRGNRDELSEKVERLLEDRKNKYFRIPIRLDATNMTPPEAAKKIIDILKMKIKVLDKLHEQYILIQ